MMDKSLDMSLDDIIKSKKSAGRGRGSAPRGRGARGGSFSGGRRGGGGRGSGRQVPLGVNIRSSSSAIAKTSRRPKNFSRQPNLFVESLAAAGLPRMESGIKLHISNLDSGVSNNDIRELFSEIGELKRYAIHYDKSGRPSGSAEVVYANKDDAFTAYKRYNSVQLDGRPMKIEIVRPNADVPISAHINTIGGTNGKATRRVVMAQAGRRPMGLAPANRGVGQRTRGGFIRNGQGRAQIQGRGMGRGQGQLGGRGRGRGRGRGKKQEKSAEELDKELENYHAEGMTVD